MSSPIPTDITRAAYSIAEVAAMGVFRKSRLYELINDGTLPARLAGSRRVILADDLAKFIRDLPPVPISGRRRRRLHAVGRPAS
jgi:hypothetical protein